MNRNDRAVVGLVMVSHALVHTYELSIPILMVIWLAEFPVTEATLGTVVAVGYGLFGIGALPSGIVSDRYGSQRMIALCLFGMGLSFAVLSVAPNLVAIGAATCLWGAAASIYHPAGLSLLSTGVEDSGSGFAYHGMAGNAGIALGPLVAVLLVWLADWRTAALALAIPAFLAVGFILRAEIDEMAAVSAETDGGERGSSDIASLSEFVSASRGLFVGGFVLVFLVVIFNGLYYRGILTFLPDLLSDFVGDVATIEAGRAGDELEGSDFIYIGLLTVGVVGQFAGGKATDRIPVERGLMLGYAALVVIALLYAPAAQSGLVALVAISAVLGFVLFFLQPMYQVAVAEYSPADARGLSYGYTYLAQFGVGALGASLVGIVLTYGTTSAVFLAVAGFAVVAAALSTVLLVRR